MSKTIEVRAQEIRKAALSGYAWNVPAAWEDADPVARGYWIGRAALEEQRAAEGMADAASTPQNDPAKYALEALRR